MRLALFSDIHGNRIVLDAVIADAEALGVDAYWAAGSSLLCRHFSLAVPPAYQHFNE